MFSIAICDDNKVFGSYLKDMILKTYEEKVYVEIYFSGNTLYDALSNESYFDLIFLDIQMEFLNGIDLGKKIRDDMKNELIQIVYISAIENYAIQLFRIKPLDFLLKPVRKEDVIYNIEEAMKIIQKQTKFFQFTYKKTLYQIRYEDILYFNSCNKKIEIITTKGKKEFYAKLSDIIEETKEHKFFSIHKSYLVNFIHISEYHSDYIVLSDQTSLPVSYTFRKKIREELLKNQNERWNDAK